MTETRGILRSPMELTDCPYNQADGHRCSYPSCVLSDSPSLDGTCFEALEIPSDELLLNLCGGRTIDLRNPNVRDINILDIAGALSRICRFAGHVPSFYSVAQHCVIVSNALPHDLALAGLLHDASEAYLNDITRALKYSREMTGYRRLEDTMQRTIYRAFGVPEEMSPRVKVVDQSLGGVEFDTMLRGRTVWEARYGLPRQIETVSPERAELIFLDRFAQLYLGPTIHLSV